MGIHSAQGSFTRPSPPVTEVNTFPSPIRGIDNRIPLSSNDDQVCIYSFNLVPSSYGMEVRSGYREWQIGLDNGAGLGVGTIIPFEGNAEGPADDRLFAATNEGIWDVTVVGDAPVLKVAFANTAVTAGYGSFAQYIDANNDTFLYYADSVNGLYEYVQTTDTWAIATNITGATISLINFVVVHKQRIWFCEQNSTLGWYLAVGARVGAATPFNFGAKFKHGGGLVGLYNWTVDGGDGIDDFLIAVSSAGDVLPYKGSDPTQADWSIVGTYFIGSMANGSRCASQYGGNTTLLSSYGIIQMSDLLRGVDPRRSDSKTTSDKITEFIRTDMRQYRNEDGWDIKQLPGEGLMLITSPRRNDGTYLQYAYRHDVGGWGFWRGIPINTIDTWDDSIYFGTKDGRIFAMDVTKDNILLTPPAPPAVNGENIDFSILMNYQDFGTPAVFKRGKLIRPNFVSFSDVAFNAQFLYDYSITEVTLGAIGATAPDTEWDVSRWDLAVWGDSQLAVFDKAVGGTGLGRYVSVAIKGSAISKTRLASTDVFWDRGGSL